LKNTLLAFSILAKRPESRKRLANGDFAAGFGAEAFRTAVDKAGDAAGDAIAGFMVKGNIISKPATKKERDARRHERRSIPFAEGQSARAR
jgi:hypothetical protein